MPSKYALDAVLFNVMRICDEKNNAPMFLAGLCARVRASVHPFLCCPTKKLFDAIGPGFVEQKINEVVLNSIIFG